ncbi:MAG TPA: S8 family serine peptidase, partial [Anaerolineales bacterium]|nr:S8 family serine peptidase [Anaerolineales bacterium]
MNTPKQKTFYILSIFIILVLLIAPLQSILAQQAAPNQQIAQQDNIQPQTSDPKSKIEPLLLKQITRSSQADFFIWLAEKADLSEAANLSTKEAKGQFVFDTLRETAERTQKNLRAYLDSQGISYQPYYIANKILVRSGGETLLLTLAARPDVARITANHTFQLEEPMISPEGKIPDSPDAVEGNIGFVNADDVWAAGITGVGTVLAGNDTGMDWEHPALINQYRGWNGATADHNYNWWDATGTYPNAPGDGFGHGTHTTGTMVGDDGGTNQIGMAPGAKTIHCKNLDDFGGGDDATITECFEWDLAPWDLNGQNPLPGMAPDAVNNSWGYSPGGYTAFVDEIAALQAAGILIEVSAGNEGASCQTLRSPGDYSEVLTTGSVGWTGGSLPGSLTWFSSRGPSTLTGDYLPDVMAPGEFVRSALPGGGYEAWDGTSMAGPHVTGLIGLLWSANPALRGLIPETHQIIAETAVPLTGQSGSNCGGDYTDGPNNDWGYGTMDAFAAVETAILYGGAGTLAGTVTDSSNADPLEGVLVQANLTSSLGFKATTGPDGHYSRVVFSGTYTVTATLYGYYQEQ